MKRYCKLEVEECNIVLETGKLAKQAGGSVVVRSGDTIVLVTAVAAQKGREGIDFFPLTVDYREKTYAAGKIPGGFFKREGRPTDRETLTSRLIDRPIRPLFPKGFTCETQVIATVLSVDGKNDAAILALTGASAALMISDIPFTGPIVVNPPQDEMENSDLDIVMACSLEAVVMVEGGARELSEDVIVEALKFGHQAAQPLLRVQSLGIRRLSHCCGFRKIWPNRLVNKSGLLLLLSLMNSWLPWWWRNTAPALLKVWEGLAVDDKLERRDYFSDLKAEIAVQLESRDIPVNDLGEIFENQLSAAIRQQIYQQRVRIGGRAVDEVRQISCEVGLLPRVHGSALFTRGETQALVTGTLGTSSDEQRIDSLLGESFKRFMLHYNFPPYSVGEARFLRGPGRREIGHGTLAERALTPVLPSAEEFPYTIRVVSDILESNGSSSMATVCGGSLALMDGGVPLKAPVAGIAMGLVKEGDDFIVLTDILGDEDHVGDMDFKVTGTREGITAIQMDIKITGISQEIMKKALDQAREGRLSILENMEKCLDKSREDISTYAPRIITITVHQDKIRDVIGPGGKNIRAIVEKTGAKIDIEDSGEIKIASADETAADMAIGR